MEVYRESGMEEKACDLAVLFVSFHIFLLKQTNKKYNQCSLSNKPTYIVPKCPPILIERHSRSGDCHQNFSLGTITFEEHPPLVT